MALVMFICGYSSFLSCLWCDQFKFTALFYGYNLRSVPGFIFFRIVVVFNFFYRSFPVTNHVLDLFSGTYLNKLSVSVVPSDYQSLARIMTEVQQTLTCRDRTDSEYIKEIYLYMPGGFL